MSPCERLLREIEQLDDELARLERDLDVGNTDLVRVRMVVREIRLRRVREMERLARKGDDVGRQGGWPDWPR